MTIEPTIDPTAEKSGVAVTPPVADDACGGCRAPVTRRSLLGASAAVAAGLALTACGDSGDSGSGNDDPGTADGGSGGDGTNGGTNGTDSGPGTVLGRTSEIPVGGGKVFDKERVVVTQPTAGEFKAFSAVCTHQGALVNKVADGRITCPLHGSQFAITDGAVLQDPARVPLPAAPDVRFEGDEILMS